MADPEPKTQAARILIVEDDFDIREALAEMLQARGFEVETATHGLDALRLLHGSQQLPQAIILDLMMPVMDGYSFLEERNKDPRLAAIPVTVVTAGSAVDHHRLGTAHPVLRKPIKVTQLLDILGRLTS